MAQMEAALAAHEQIDLVYAHNDPMAVGRLPRGEGQGPRQAR